MVFEHDLEPAWGPGTPVAPPTYPGPSRYAHSPDGFVPRATDSSWLSDVVRDESGRPVSADTVVLDEVQSQSGRAEAALWDARYDLGGLPGFTVTGKDGSSELPAGDQSADGAVQDAYVTSWTAGHRHADSWIQTATEEPGGAPIWKAGGAVRELLQSMNATVDASTLFAYAPNSLLFGFWLSTDVERQHKAPRAYSSRVTGHGARPVYSSVTKSDSFPISKDSVVDRMEMGHAPAKKSKGADGKRTDRPSNLGFGPVIVNMDVTGFVCEVIVARGAISLAALRGVQYGGDQTKRDAAAVALTVLGIAGDVLSRRNSHLRSGCDLVVTSSRYGLRRHGKPTPDTLDVDPNAGVDFWATALHLALEDCRKAGLEWAEPINLYLSAPQKKLISEGADATRSGEVETK
ncbi:hypothetical protein GCM10009676_45450 [Prauserella halophila]|uniref:CRISPR-associated protein Csb1 n=1 Tax=Prauserella halophila TaxID=185641 RepID=A0ABN1WL45_9PSEU